MKKIIKGMHDHLWLFVEIKLLVKNYRGYIFGDLFDMVGNIIIIEVCCNDYTVTIIEFTVVVIVKIVVIFLCVFCVQILDKITILKQETSF